MVLRDARQLRQAVGEREVDEDGAQFVAPDRRPPDVFGRARVGSEEQRAPVVLHDESVGRNRVRDLDGGHLQPFREKTIARPDRLKRDQVAFAVLHQVHWYPHPMVEYVMPQRVEIRLRRVKPDRLADLLEQVGQVKGEREYVVQMRMRDDDRANLKLLLTTQADRERAGVNRQRVVDQIGRQQLNPPIRRAWDNPEFHYCTWERSINSTDLLLK